MGWTEYNAHYYKNGKVDVKKEVEEKIINGVDYEVVKSTLKGAIWYGAVRNKKTQEVFGVVVKTSVKNNSYYNFAYKLMDETEGPCYYDCPKKIIDLLSPIDSEWANEWRKKCLESKKKNPLDELPIGTVIQFEGSNGKKETYYKHSPAYQFKRPFWMYKYEWKYISKKYIPENFEIIPS